MTATERIFVSIAAYCDPLLQFTVNNAWTSASHPERLHFGIVDQSPPAQRLALPEKARQHIRYVHIHPQDTRGACWARALAMNLHEGEEWFLQIDSHMLFERGWDERLIASAKQCQAINPRCIVSSYPNAFEIIDNKPVPKPATHKVLAHVLKAGAEFEADHPVLNFQAVPVEQDAPVRGYHLGAGCLFARGDFPQVLPYDPHLYFHGEEQTLAARAFTHGWDIFHVSGLPIYHLYNLGEATKLRPLHWSEEHDKERQQRWWERDKAAKARVRRLLCDGDDLGVYGLGRERTLDEYAVFSGLDYRQRQIGERARRGPWALDTPAPADATMPVPAGGPATAGPDSALVSMPPAPRPPG